MTENQATQMKNFVVRIPVDLERNIRMESHRQSLERNVHLKPTDLVREILANELSSSREVRCGGSQNE